MKDRDGVVEASIPGLAAAANVSIELTEDAIVILGSPDPYSRTPDHEGRRIAKVDGGWEILNHDKYRLKLDRDELREKGAKRAEKHRNLKRLKVVTPSNASSRSVTQSNASSRAVRHTDTDTDHPDRAVAAGSGFPELPDPDSGARADLVRATGARAAENPVDNRGPAQIDRSGIRARGHQVPPAPPIARHEPTISRVAHSIASPAPPLNPEAARRRKLIDAFVTRVNIARTMIAAELGIQGVRPIALMGEGEKALMDRLREADDPEGDLDHVISVAEGEARATRELRWFGWTLAEPKAWRIRLATPLPRKRAPGASRPAATSSLPPRVELTEDERAEFSALAKRLAQDPMAIERSKA